LARKSVVNKELGKIIKTGAVGAIGIGALGLVDEAVPGDQSAIVGLGSAAIGLGVLGQTVKSGMTIAKEMNRGRRKKTSNPVVDKIW
jgi:hypothetical protein